MTRLALVEVLDRDGAVRQSAGVAEWPLRVGRALDNDLVLDDPHAAPHHFSVAPDAEGVPTLQVGDSVNGLQAGGRLLRTGERLPVGDLPLPLALGRLQLRLRLASQVLPPEQPLIAVSTPAATLLQLAALVLAALAVLVFDVWLESQPDLFVRGLATQAIKLTAGLLAWSGLWTLLSKVFTHSGHFGWHLRVVLLALLAWQAVAAGCALLAFSLGWAWATDYGFVLTYLIVGAMLYFHLQAVEPAHPKRTRALALASVITGIALSLWFNLQNTDRVGTELYMNHLFPPALRLARPVDTATFLQGVEGLQPALDEKAKKKEFDDGE
jgi:hypothetical protein